MPRKPMDIVFPSLGVVRRGSLRSTSEGRGPYPSPWASNVRLEDSLTSRLRGGSFTGISAAARVSPVYRDRAITFSANAITAARQGDSTDTALSADISDVGRPILFQLSEAGSIGSDVVAVVPHKDSFLLCFTAGETWVLAGDPATGSLRRVSDEVGIIGADAWCVNHDVVYFLSSLGLYSVNADGGGLQAVSEDRIPEDLTGVSDSACTLTFRHADYGVYVHKTGQDWFYDTARKSFWPFDTDTTQSHVLLGPMRVFSPDRYGRIIRLHGVMAESSASVTWRLIVADTAEEAADNGKDGIENETTSNVHSSGSWAAGPNHSVYPRARGQWMVLWLLSSGNWAFESVSAIATASGRWR